MQNYISRINKIGADDPVNGQVLNSVLDQIQHNIDLLYSSYNSSLQNWNVSEMIFGNMLDYDQTGEKRFVNGGRLDAIEKILSFGCTVGSISFEEYTTLNNSNWLRWDIAEGITENIRLVRTISIAEQIRHQNILIAFKMVPYSGNSVVTNERYEIYVNGIFSGTAETGIHEVGGVWEPKTLYGTYNLTGTESSIEVELVRASTNTAVPADYKVRVSDVFVGLHTLGNDSFAMNYPASGSSFIGAGADINSFYDFENNSIRPIPAFLINGDRVEGNNTSVVVNITSFSDAATYQDTFYIGLSGTGNETGIDESNMISSEAFFARESFVAGPIYIHLAQADDYGDFTFNKGTYELTIPEEVSAIGINSLTVDTNSSLTVNITPHDLGTVLTIGDIVVSDNSYFQTTTVETNEVTLINNTLTITDNSGMDMEIGMLNQPIISGGEITISNNSEVVLTIADSDYINTDGEYGFGVSTGSIYVNKYSSLTINNLNNGLSMHVGAGRTPAIYLDRHSDYFSSGFANLSTSSSDKKFKARLHSSFELDHNIQSDAGPTAFTNLELLYYSSFGSTYPSGTFTETLSASLVYEL